MEVIVKECIQIIPDGENTVTHGSLGKEELIC